MMPIGVGGAQYLTLVFIGCISVSSLRAFLRNMHQARTAGDFMITLTQI